MMQKKSDEGTYTIGLDFGTLSVRAVLMNTRDGTILARETFDYPHGVITDSLPETDMPLKDYWCLQDPGDYLQGMITTVSRLAMFAQEKGISSEQIVGIGVDFTCCTVLPVKADGSALALDKAWRTHPHSWVKLWKHHAAQPQADQINILASKRHEKWLPFYGGKVSSEWFFPKLLQVLEEDQAVYDEMAKFIEAGDWIVWQLTGQERRNQSSAGYKAFYQEDLGGFPSTDFFKTLNPAFENVVAEKINAEFYAPGSKAGTLTKVMAEALHLSEKTAVSVNHIDAHVCVAATDVTTANTMLSIVGTSSVDILLADQPLVFPGFAGLVNNGAIANLFAYETGQDAVGDIFEWFVKNNVNPTYYDMAAASGQNIYQYLTQESEKLLPGQSGVLALDWWNGNRSILMDGNLTGLIVGMTLQTKPADIFRALIEATAFGKKVIRKFYNQVSHLKK